MVPTEEGTITRVRWVPTILMLAGLGASGCLDRGFSVAGPVPWSLEPAVVEAGAGIPFCEDATARVAAFMSRFEGQAPPSERYGGTVTVGIPGEMEGGLNAHIAQHL